MFVEEERDKAPFPTLIKVEKNERKPVYDLAEAVRLIKVRHFFPRSICKQKAWNFSFVLDWSGLASSLFHLC